MRFESSSQHMITLKTIKHIKLKNIQIRFTSKLTPSDQIVLSNVGSHDSGETSNNVSLDDLQSQIERVSSKVDTFIEISTFVEGSPKIAFELTNIGQKFAESAIKVKEHIQEKEQTNLLPYYDGFADSNTLKSFNVLGNYPCINKYLASVKNLSIENISAPKELVDRLVKHAVDTNLLFHEFVKSNMQTDLTMDSFPNIFTYVVQAYGQVPLESLCAAMITSTIGLDKLPSLIEDHKNHEEYLAESEEEHLEFDKALEESTSKYNDGRNERKVFSLQRISEHVTTFLRNYSRTLTLATILGGTAGVIIKNPDLIHSAADLMKNTDTLYEYFQSVTSKIMDSTKNSTDLTVTPAKSDNSTHPVVKFDKFYLLFRQYLISIFGDPRK